MRRLKWLFISVVLIGLVASCAPPTPKVVKETVVVTKPVEVTKIVEVTKVVEKPVVVTPTPAPPKIRIVMGDKLRPPSVEKAVEMVKKKHPDWEIEIETPPDAEMVFLASMAAGKGPDIYHIDTFKVPDTAEAGYLMDLTPFLEKWPDWAQYPDSMKGIVTYKGKTYAVVWDTDVRLLYYRKDLFEKAGIPLPWQPKSWDDILDAARKLKAAGVEYPLLHQSGRNWDEGTTMQSWFPLLWGAGGKLYNWEEGKWVVTSKEHLDVLKYYRTIYEEGLAPPEMATEPKPWDIAYTRFVEGTSAILMDGSWVWGECFAEGRTYEIPDREKVVGLAVFPGKEAGFSSAAGGWSWAITSQARNPEAAFEVLSTICSKEVTTDFCVVSAHVAPRMDVAEEPAYKADPFLAWCVKEVLPYAKYRPTIPPYPKISLQVQLMVERVASLEMTPEEALAKFADAVEMLVGKENTIRE